VRPAAPALLSVARRQRAAACRLVSEVCTDLTAVQELTPVLAIGSNAAPQQLARKYPAKLFPEGVAIPVRPPSVLNCCRLPLLQPCRVHVCHIQRHMVSARTSRRYNRQMSSGASCVLAWNCNHLLLVVHAHAGHGPWLQQRIVWPHARSQRRCSGSQSEQRVCVHAGHPMRAGGL
jgi:hypothetical protein